MSARRRFAARVALAAWAMFFGFALHSQGADRPLEGYADYTTFQAQIKALAGTEFTELRSLGTTLGKREIYQLRVGTGKADEKPALWIVGSVHAPHLLGSELAVRIAQRLVAAAGKEPAVRALLERVTFYILPRPSPDASEACFHPPYREATGNQRVTRRPDQVEDEGGPADLNGDGTISMLRVQDANGTFVPHPNDPRVMIPAGEKRGSGPRYALYVEGRGSEDDGPFRVGPADGVDFNRNFPHRYPSFEPGAGPHAVSEIETRAVADFAFEHRNLVAVVCFTPEDNLLNPWKPDPAADKQPLKTTVQAADVPYIGHVADIYRELLGRKDTPEPAAGAGSFSEWMYYQMGRWSFACRGWWVPKVEEEKRDAGETKREAGKGPPSTPALLPDHFVTPAGEGREELNALRWFAREKIDGFVDWKPIVHPDLPGRKVEVGGFKPLVRLNPPAKELEPLADRHWMFVRKLVELFPRVRVQEVAIEPLAAGLYRVRAVVVNDGYLPTVGRMGDISQQHQLLQIKLALPNDARLVTGVARVEVPVLAGNGGRHEQTWLVRLPHRQPLQVRVWCPSVGEDTKEIKLAD